MAGELGRQNIDRQDKSLCQRGGLRISLHHLLIGEDLWATDFESTVDLRWQVRCQNEITQYVTHRDWLHLRSHPTWSDHRRESLGEIAQHLKRCRTRTDDYCGTKFHRRHAAFTQNLANFYSRAHVSRHVRLRDRRRKPAQIDDAADVRALCSYGKRGSHLPFGNL